MNKEEERFYLDRFNALYEEFPGGKIVETERPDFLLVTESETIGIEVTELHRSREDGVDTEQISQVCSEQIVRGAQADYEALGLPYVYVTVHFNLPHQIQKSDVQRLRQLLRLVVERNIPDVGEEKFEEPDWRGLTDFPDEIYRVTVRRLPIQEENFFNSPMTTWVGNLTEETLTRVIQAKEKKIPDYRQRCDRLWMLIVSDTRQISTWFNSDEDDLIMNVASGFDRVFLLRNFLSRVHELNVLPDQLSEV